MSFFILNLFQVPQVDIERLPASLLGDILSSHIYHTEDEEEHDEEKEDDIYSLEHQENIEEFELKGIILDLNILYIL